MTPADTLNSLPSPPLTEGERAIRSGEVLPTTDYQAELAALATRHGISARTLSYRGVMRAIPTETEAGRGIRFRMSTAGSDRYNDIVAQEFELEQFRKNPVAPWNHDYSIPPVGRWEDVAVVRGESGDPELRGTLIFDSNPENKLARLVESQYRSGFLSCVSVGFMPGSAVQRNSLDEDDPHYARSGFVFRQNQLLEVSAVMVPGNAEALALARSILPSPPEPKPVDKSGEDDLGPWARFLGPPSPIEPADSWAFLSN